MTEEKELRAPKAPPAWFNVVVRQVMRTPGLRRALDRDIAVLTVTGAKTGRRYAIPVQPLGWDGRWIVLSLRSRRWWRNLPNRPRVEWLRRGGSVPANAEILDDSRTRTAIADCLRRHPRTARRYGLDLQHQEPVDDRTLDRLTEMLVAIVVDPVVPD